MREATAKKDFQEDLVVKTQILQYTYYHCKFSITPPPLGIHREFAMMTTLCINCCTNSSSIILYKF